MKAEILVAAVALGPRACRDVESKKIDQVNEQFPLVATALWAVSSAKIPAVNRPQAGDHNIPLYKFSRQFDRPPQQAQVMIPRNFNTAKLLQVRG